MTGLRGRDAERVGYVDGQLLASRDLRDDSAYEAGHRALHVRALHGTWGIALGLRVAVGENGTRVRVGAGLGYDCRGRDILLSEEVAIGAPVLPSGTDKPVLFDLVCSHASADEVAPAPADGVACTASSPGERPRIRWATVAGAGTSFQHPVSPPARLGEELPLGRFTVQPGGTIVGPDPSVRRIARAALRPHIGSALVGPGDLPWKFANTGLTATIDTTAAAFSETPFYFARLVHPAWSGGGVLGPFVSVAEPRRHSFRLDLVFPTSPGNFPFAQTSAFWLGVEPFVGCPPAIGFIPILAAGLFDQ